MPIKSEWFGEKVRQRARDAVVRRLTAAGEAGVQTAISLVPVDTGFLKSTINYAIMVDQTTLVLYADANYSLYVEMGHHTASGSWVAPAPFLRPGALVAEDSLRTGRGGGIVTTQYGGPTG